MLKPYFLFMLLILCNFVALPLIISKILCFFGNHVQQILVNSLGSTSQVAFGGLGVIIHELAHLITAILFGYHINNFKLLEPKKYKSTGTLGYVDFSCVTPNLYNNVGNFFIGLSPCFACSASLWLIHNLLFHQSWAFQFNGYNFDSVLHLIINNLILSFGNLSWQSLLYLVLVVMISSTGYGLSKADIHTAFSGMPYWIVLVVVVSALLMLLGLTSIITLYMWKCLTILLTFLFQGLIYIIFSWLVLKTIFSLNHWI